MKKIDLSGYSEAELIELNHHVIERIKAMRQARIRSTMDAFKLGDRVSFRPDSGQEITGTIVRLNRKSITVATAEGVQWRVAPALLTKRDHHESGGVVVLPQGDPLELPGLRSRDRGKA